MTNYQIELLKIDIYRAKRAGDKTLAKDLEAILRAEEHRRRIEKEN